MRRLILAATISAATSQSTNPTTYSVYDYDLTTPRFTPDGRLMQVEYASSAPDLSSPLIALPIPLGDVPGAILEADGISRTRGECRLIGKERATGECEVAVILAAIVGAGGEITRGEQARRRGQSRIVALQTGPPPSTRSSPSSHIVLGLSGVLSDSVSLLKTGRNHISSYGRMYGLHRLHPTTVSFVNKKDTHTNLPHMMLSSPSEASSPEVARRVARLIADECQMRSFGGGIRPYGSSVLVCGVDSRGATVCVTDAGGRCFVFCPSFLPLSYVLLELFLFFILAILLSLTAYRRFGNKVLSIFLLLRWGWSDRKFGGNCRRLRFRAFSPETVSWVTSFPSQK